MTAAVVAAVLAGLVAGAFALGILGGRPERTIRTGPLPPGATSTTLATSPTATAPLPTEPSTTTPEDTAPPSTVAEAPTLAPATASTVTTARQTAPSVAPPTAAPRTVPETTTTVAMTTTVPPTTTTTLPPPATVTIVGSCAFSPASLTRPRGSVVRFQNGSSDTVTVAGAGPPGAGNVFFNLEPGGVSGPYVLSVPGTYGFQCQGAGTGQIAITAT